MILHALIVGLYLAFLVWLGWLEHRRAERGLQRFDALMRPSPAWTGNLSAA